MKEEILVVENGTINKFDNKIYTELYLQIFKQEIIGIIFDNILEKKYLLNLLKGDLTLDSGRIYLGNDKISKKESPGYFTKSIAIIDKTGKLIDSLSVLENIMLFTPYMGELLFGNRKQLQILNELQDRLHLILPLNRPVTSLSPVERVTIELVKAYIEGKKLIALTDITGFLKNAELAEIFTLICRLKELGMTFAIIESFEDIVFEWTDRLIVIQNGRTVGIFQSKETKRHQIYSALIGKQNKHHLQNLASLHYEEQADLCSVLRFSNINTEILENVTFSMEKGEVLKLYYMDDSSCMHIVELLKGVRKASSGRIYLSEQEYSVNTIHQAVDKGICFVEESPYDNMLLYDMSVLDNLTLSLAKKVPLIWVKKRYLKSIQGFVSQFFDDDISKVKLSGLSPLKLQQIVYLKWLLFAPDIVVCIKPFTEVDIHLQEITISMIEMLRKRGIAVIILTPNISEINRVEGETIYVRNGKIIDEDAVYQILYGEDND